MGKLIDRTAEIQGKFRWAVEPMLDKESAPIKNGGYFPSYSVITYKGKKAVVLVDCRDAVVKVICGWFDDIIGMTWDGDYRWNSDKPCVVVNNGRYNLVKEHSNKLLLTTEVKSIVPKWKYNKEFGHYAEGVDFDNNEIIITRKGSVYKISANSVAQLTATLNEVKGWDNAKIQKEWIDKDMPCGYICGFEYKGARLSLIPQERAKELFKTHHRLTGMFNSAEWRFFDGKVILLFRDYSGSDYD